MKQVAATTANLSQEYNAKVIELLDQAEAKHEAELKIQLKQKEQDVIAQKDQESATMVEKAVTINTQKLEAQHSERIDSALRQAASDAAADKEVALSKQWAQLKEEAEANAAAAVQDAEIKLREIANQELARQEQELKDEMAKAHSHDKDNAVTLAKIALADEFNQTHKEEAKKSSVRIHSRFCV